LSFRHPSAAQRQPPISRCRQQQERNGQASPKFRPESGSRG
jgi:hypothetical protein